MKKVFLFGRFVRIYFVLSLSFFTYAFVDMTIQSQFAIKYILMMLVVFIFVVFGILWIYSLGIVIDKKKNSAKLILGLSDRNIHERALSNIASIDVEKDGNLGMNFILHYNYGASEKLYYKFYRVSFVEEIQFKRIKKSLSKLKF